MATRVTPVILGIDVSKEWLDVCQHGDGAVIRIANERRAIKQLLRAYPAAALAVEATNTYHELVVELALIQGLTVYLINGYQLKHYARSLGQRMQTDRIDAQLLARLLAHEIDELRPYQPRSKQQVQVRRLLNRRALLVNQQQRLRQSLQGLDSTVPEEPDQAPAAVIALIERRLKTLARTGWQSDLALLCSIPGVGPLRRWCWSRPTTAATSATGPVHRLPRLDVRSKDSASSRRRKLSKCAAQRLAAVVQRSHVQQPGRPYFHETHLALQARACAHSESVWWGAILPASRSPC